MGLTHIRVYDSPGPDGLVSGGAHIHLVCSEIYFPLAGTGQLEILSMEGLETIDLVPNKAQKREVNVAMSNSFGFGGHNACILVGQIE